MSSRRSMNTAPLAGNEAQAATVRPAPNATAARLAQSPAVISGTIKMIDYLASIIGKETELLQQRGPINLGEFTEKKSKGLLDLGKALGALGSGSIDERIRARLEFLQIKLQENEAILALHMEAVRQVAEILASTALAAESDGTYTRLTRNAGQTP